MSLFQLDFFVYMIVIMLIIGGVLVIAASLGFGKNSDEAKDITEKLDALEITVSEADETMSELNDMTKNAMKEFDAKYQELLFLYNLIDEKQKNVNGGSTAKPSRQSKSVDMIIDDSKKMSINPKFTNVLEMYKNGKGVEEIAKQLDMGKGEVGLIISLGGAKNA
ncbi:MAG: hypothetical protein FWE44_01710 [Defluviitaleaceae bacterium]|nr:hypothetical protein [Defluviitaleaceae bacterium]